MNEEEIRDTIEQIRAQAKAMPEHKDKSDDEIDEIMLDGFYDAYKDGKLSKEDLDSLAGVMGYEFTDEFEEEEETDDADDSDNDDEDEKQEKLGNLSKKELEDTRTMAPGESKEEFKERIDEAKEEASDEESEEDERKRASELWKMNLNK